MVAGKKTTFACIIMIAVLVFVASTNGAISRDMLFFADALYLPLLFRDIFELGGSLSDWYQTPAPYWFPDYLLFIPSALLAKTNYIRIAIMAVVQTMSSVFACWFLARQLKFKQPLLAGTFVAALLVLAGLGSQWPAVIVFLSAHHYSAILMTLIILGLIISLYPVRHHYRKNTLPLTIVFLLATATIASDRIIIVQGILPILGALAIQGFFDEGYSVKKTWKSIWAFAVLLVAGVMLGRDVAWHFRRNHPGVEPSINLARVGESFSEVLKTLGNIGQSDPVAACMAIFGALICFASIRKIWRQKDGVSWKLFILAAMLSAFKSLAVFILTAEPAAVPRYYSAVFLMPVIAGGFLLFDRLSARPKYQYLAVAMVYVLILIRIEPWSRKISLSYTPDHVTCVEREVTVRGLDHGIADYFDSMVIMGMTDNRINMAHFTPGPELKPYRWIATERQIKGTYDFAAVSEDPKFRLMLPESLGTPREVIQCGKLELRFFGKNGLKLEGL